MNKEYIHYGHTNFDKALFTPISNNPTRNKPGGGLWASPKDAAKGWEQWNISEGFSVCRKENSFSFTLSEEANVIHIKSMDDISLLPLQDSDISKVMKRIGILCIDYEALIDAGYDAVELHISEGAPGLVNALYGWDCDSIVILNPEIVVPLEKEIKDAGNLEDIGESFEEEEFEDR